MVGGLFIFAGYLFMISVALQAYTVWQKGTAKNVSILLWFFQLFYFLTELVYSFVLNSLDLLAYASLETLISLVSLGVILYVRSDENRGEG